jgi:hypothetical protein
MELVSFFFSPCVLISSTHYIPPRLITVDLVKTINYEVPPYAFFSMSQSNTQL